MVCVLDTFLHLIPFFSHLESKLGHIWLRGDVRHHLAVLLSSLIPIFVPDNSARKNPNTSGNPQHLDLLPVLPGTLPLPHYPPSSPFPYCKWYAPKEPAMYLHTRPSFSGLANNVFRVFFGRTIKLIVEECSVDEVQFKWHPMPTVLPPISANPKVDLEY